MTTEEDRLRRELRAMGAVNRQLQAQLDEPASATKQRRSTSGGEWIDALAARGASSPTLVRSSRGEVFVVEGDQKRAVRAGILAAALEELIGSARDTADGALGKWDDGVPVELFEAPSGPPFIVIGGRRHTVRGVPLPHPVSNKQASEFPEGDDVNVAAANVARRKYQEATSPRFQIERLKTAVQQRGLTGTAKSAARRVRNKLT
jgi:hypothetical protein